MAEQPPGEPPSRWTVINEYSKTVVAVCAALLAFIGAFSAKLLEGKLSKFVTVDIDVTIGLLGLAALFALAVPAMLDRYLCIATKGKGSTWATEKNLDSATEEEWKSRKTRIWWTKAVANLSYVFLALAVVGMTVFALCRPAQDAAGDKGGRVEGSNLQPVSTSSRYEVVYSAMHHTNHGQEAHTFLLDKSTGQMWQMVCSADGLVSFRRIRRLNLDGTVETTTESAPVAVLEKQAGR